MKKYKILSGQEHERRINIDGAEIVVHRIEAAGDMMRIGPDGNNLEIKKGSLGGWVEGEHNLSPFGACWIGDDAVVCQNARVKQNAVVLGNAIVSGNAVLDEGAMVFGNARVSGNCELFGMCFVYDNARVTGDSVIFNGAAIGDNAVINGTRETNRKGYSKQLVLKGPVHIYGNSEITGASFLNGEVNVYGNSRIDKCYLDGKIDVLDADIAKETFNGRYMIHGSERICYFEKTRVPRKFIIKNGNVKKEKPEEKENGNTGEN